MIKSNRPTPGPSTKPPPQKHASPSIRAPRVAPKETNPTRGRLDRLVELIDHCQAAKTISEQLGEKFLGYLLSMAIQEARNDIRRTPR